MGGSVVAWLCDPGNCFQYIACSVFYNQLAVCLVLYDQCVVCPALDSILLIRLRGIYQCTSGTLVAPPGNAGIGFIEHSL